MYRFGSNVWYRAIGAGAARRCLGTLLDGLENLRDIPVNTRIPTMSLASDIRKIFTFELTKLDEKNPDPGNSHRSRVTITHAFEELSPRKTKSGM
jgi:hypothetical protein